MKTRVLIAAILFSFMLVGPASAVKRVPKSVNQATDQRQKERQDVQAPEKGTPPPERRQNSSRDEAKPQPPEKPSDDGHRDRFIDRDGDGINDNIKKPPETVKRKNDEKSDRSHDGGSDRNHKSDKDRRSR
jgi:hypothetical protein